jgi:putative flippase GtrA
MQIQSFLRTTSGGLIGEAAKYFAVGSAAFVVDALTLAILVSGLRCDYLWAASIGFAAGLIVNYYLGLKFVFGGVDQATAGEFSKVAGIALFGLALTEAGMFVGVDMIGLHYLVAKAATAAIVFIWNFGARKALVYGDRRPDVRSA